MKCSSLQKNRKHPAVFQKGGFMIRCQRNVNESLPKMAEKMLKFSKLFLPALTKVFALLKTLPFQWEKDPGKVL